MFQGDYVCAFALRITETINYYTTTTNFNYKSAKIM